MLYKTSITLFLKPPADCLVIFDLKLHLHLYRLLATTTKYIININFTLKQTSSENLDC